MATTQFKTITSGRIRIQTRGGIRTIPPYPLTSGLWPITFSCRSVAQWTQCFFKSTRHGLSDYPLFKGQLHNALELCGSKGTPKNRILRVQGAPQAQFISPYRGKIEQNTPTGFFLYYHLGFPLQQKFSKNSTPSSSYGRFTPLGGTLAKTYVSVSRKNLRPWL